MLSHVLYICGILTVFLELYLLELTDTKRYKINHEVQLTSSEGSKVQIISPLAQA